MAKNETTERAEPGVLAPDTAVLMAAFTVAFLLSALLLAACGGGGGNLEVTIASPANGEVLREEPFLVTGAISGETGRSGVWLMVGSVADGQYYPVSSITVDAAQGSSGALPWSAQFYNGVCQDSFVPGSREVAVVRASGDLLATIADSLALKQPMARPQLEGQMLASVVVDIQKPDPAFCAGVVPGAPEGPAPGEGGTPSEGSP